MQGDPVDTATESVERLARQVAMWHGQKMVRGRATLAATMGYGEFSDASARYVRDHWHQYTSVVDAMILPAIARAEAAEAERDALLAVARLVRRLDNEGELALLTPEAVDEMDAALDSLPPGTLDQSDD